MDWIYVYLCEDSYIYIGTTHRLFIRQNEHKSDKGSNLTREYKPIKLIGLYKFNKSDKFKTREEYEDYITLYIKYIYHYILKKDQNLIRGGKYTKEIDNKINIDISIPYCNCKMPCRISNNGDYVCSMTSTYKFNSFHDHCKSNDIKISDSCDFNLKVNEYKPKFCFDCKIYTQSNFNRCYECNIENNKPVRLLHKKII